MKSTIIVAFTALATLFASCVKETTTDTPSTKQFTLGAVMDQTGSVVSRAATTSPLSQGLQFRMYVMPRGVVDPARQILNRTYTISDAIGTPSMDAGQQEIKLAIGDYDCYLVGPLTGVDQSGAAVDIAAEMGVNVHIGNDIISSHTPLSIKVGANTLNPTPLSHRMAKAEFVIERPNDATYTNLKVERITLSGQPTTGSFAFGADGGSITPATATTTRTYAPSQASQAAMPEKFVALDYIFAQPSKELKIETTFKATSPIQGVDTERTYVQSGKVTTAVAVGEFHRFTANPITPVELLWRLKMVPWSDKIEGDTSIDNMELLLSYSGLDAPITIDGKQYWRDRSGNGNHALMNSTASYNATEKYYTGGTESVPGFTLPSLGPMQDLTVEMVLTTVTGGRTYPIYCFDTDGVSKAFAINLPWDDNVIYLDMGPDYNQDRLGPHSYRKGDLSTFTRISTWQYTRKVNSKTSSDVGYAIWNDGKAVTSRNDRRYIDINFHSGVLLRDGGAATKLYAVRIYRRVLSPAELANNAVNDRAKYAKLLPTTDYVKEGLILDLRGETAPNAALVSGKSVWVDSSMEGNHGVITGAVTHQPATKSYSFAGTNGNLITLIKALGDLNNCTVELVLKPQTVTNTTTLYFSNTELVGSDDKRRLLHVHYLWASDFLFNSPEGSGNIRVKQNNLTYPKVLDQITTLTLVRDGKNSKLRAYQNSILQGTANTSPTILPINQALFGGQPSGQPYKGEIYGIRVYNRILTDAERQSNYNEDILRYAMSVVQ